MPRYNTGCARHTRRWMEWLEDRRLLAVITVNTELDVVDSKDGLTSLREAISAANMASGPNEIVFDFGHDGPASLELQLGELEITEALTITGDGPDLLSIDAQRNSRIFNITAAGGDFAVAGMTLARGFANDFDNGGAIRSLTTGSLAIENSAVNNSGAAGNGGGLYAKGNVSVNSSTFRWNGVVDPQRGGAIFSAGHVTVSSSVISQNGAFEGGGIYAGGNVTITSSTISRNSALPGIGGGIRAAGDVTVNSSTVEQNSAEYGGGMSGNDVTVNSSTISGNTTLATGGGIRAYGDVSANSSTISGNSAGYFGGGIAGRNVTVDSSTVSGNLAGRDGGGGIGASGNALRIDNSIVAGNGTGLGPPDVASLNATLTVQHSLIGDNNGTSLVEAPIGSPDANGNLIGGPINGVIDPLLGPLANNGGPTLTRALLPRSPAIDAGDPSFSPPPNHDQRGAGFDRVFNGRVDMGAYELQFVPTTGDLNGDQRVDAADAGILFAEWTTDSAIADLNDDGIVDAADAAIVFSNWTGDSVVHSIARPATIDAKRLLPLTEHHSRDQRESNSDSVDEAFRSFAKLLPFG